MVTVEAVDGTAAKNPAWMEKLTGGALVLALKLESPL
jgi:hypothetical protein